VNSNHRPLDPARVRAAEVLLDRAHGKPMQTTQIDQTITKRAEDMTDDELATIAAGGNPFASPNTSPNEPARAHV
jgi:hypothetical protein